MRRAFVSHMFVVTKDVFCHDKTFVVTNMCLLRQVFVGTEFLFRQLFCRDKHNFVVAKVLLWQAYFFWDKRHVLS